jgi:hypothetical protein
VCHRNVKGTTSEKQNVSSAAACAINSQKPHVLKSLIKTEERIISAIHKQYSPCQNKELYGHCTSSIVHTKIKKYIDIAREV